MSEDNNLVHDLKIVAQETMDSNDSLIAKCEQLEIRNNMLSLEKRSLREQLNEMSSKYSMAMNAIKDIEADHSECDLHTNTDFQHHQDQLILKSHRKDRGTQTNATTCSWF